MSRDVCESAAAQPVPTTSPSSPMSPASPTSPSVTHPIPHHGAVHSPPQPRRSPTTSSTHSRVSSVDSTCVRRSSSPYVLSAMALLASTPTELAPELAPVPVVSDDHDNVNNVDATDDVHSSKDDAVKVADEVVDDVDAVDSTSNNDNVNVNTTTSSTTKEESSPSASNTKTVHKTIEDVNTEARTDRIATTSLYGAVVDPWAEHAARAGHDKLRSMSETHIRVKPDLDITRTRASISGVSGTASVPAVSSATSPVRDSGFASPATDRCAASVSVTPAAARSRATTSAIPTDPETARIQLEIERARQQQAELQLKLEHQRLLLQQEQIRLQQMELENKLQMQQLEQQRLQNASHGLVTPISTASTSIPDLSAPTAPSTSSNVVATRAIDMQLSKNHTSRFREEEESLIASSSFVSRTGTIDSHSSDEALMSTSLQSAEGERAFSSKPLTTTTTPEIPKVLPYPQCERLASSDGQGRRHSSHVYPLQSDNTGFGSSRTELHRGSVDLPKFDTLDDIQGYRSSPLESRTAYHLPTSKVQSENFGKSLKFPPAIVKRIVSNFDLSTVADVLPFLTISSEWFQGCAEFMYEDLRIVKPYRLLELFKHVKGQPTIDYAKLVKHISLPYISREDWPIYREILEACSSSLISVTFGSKEDSLENIGEDWFTHGIVFEKLEKISVYRGCRNIPERLIVALLRRCKDRTVKAICLDSAFSSLGGAFWFLLQQKAGENLRELILTSPQFLQQGCDQSWDAKLFQEALPALVKTSWNITSLDLSNIPSTNVDLSLLLQLPLMEFGLPNGLYDGHLLQIQKYLEKPDCKLFRLWVAFDNVPPQQYADLLKQRPYALAPPNRFSTSVILEFLKAIGTMVRRRKEYIFMEYMKRIDSSPDCSSKLLTVEKNQPLFWLWIPCIVVDIRNAKWVRTSINVLPNLGSRYDRVNSSFIWNNVWVGLPGSRSLPQ